MAKQFNGVSPDFLTPQALADLPSDTAVLLAFSGGADSCALLHFLAECSKKDGFSLYLAHVNHGIRGEEALRDRDFCRQTAKKYGLELFVLDCDVPAKAAMEKRGLEETARDVRYAFFADIMKEKQIPLLATAHHADDQLETVLFRLARGTGLAGLCGIQPVRPFANGFLTRPMLQASRREILAYCAQKNLTYVTDSTNSDTAYARNRIRADIIPILETLFENPQRKAGELLCSLREDEALLSGLADELYQNAKAENDLLLFPLQQASPTLCNRVFMRWVYAVTGQYPERTHLEALKNLVLTANRNGEVALSRDYFAALELGRLRIFSKRTKENQAILCRPFSTESFFCDGGRIRVCIENQSANTKINNLSTQSYIFFNQFSDIIKGSLYWRTRREGDTLFISGMHKSLRKLYAKADIPMHRREQIPLLCDDEGILWAPFVGGRDGLSIENGTCLVTVELLSAPAESVQKNDFFT